MTRIVAVVIDIILIVCSVLSVDLYGDNVKKYKAYEDVSYGTNARHKLDLYLPQTKIKELGLVVFIHGGTWHHGSKDGMRKRCKKFAKKGYAAATLNYRLTVDGATANDMIDDISLAMAKIKKLAADKKVRINKVMPVGISAGGHLALLFAYKKIDTSPIKPVAAVAYAPPTDLYSSEMYISSRLGSSKKMADRISILCGKKHTYKTKEKVKNELMSVSPYYNVTKKSVPTLIAHGIKDTAVVYAQSDRLIKKLKKYGVPCNLVTFPNSAHHLDNDPDKRALFNQYIDEYAFVYLKY